MPFITLHMVGARGEREISDPANPTKLVPPVPAPRRAGRKPEIYEHLRRWECDGLSDFECEILRRASWDPVRRDHVLKKLAAGRVTDEMLAALLLEELSFREWMASEGWEDDASATLSFYRWVLIGRLRSDPTPADRTVFEALDALEWRRVESEPALRDQEIRDALVGLGRQHPKVFHELRELHHQAQQSRKATIPRAMRDRMPKSRWLPYEPIGDRPQWRRKADTLRKELTEPFISGTRKYRCRRIAEWRRSMNEKRGEPNRFANFEQ